jgi:hypothetical protein
MAYFIGTLHGDDKVKKAMDTQQQQQQRVSSEIGIWNTLRECVLDCLLSVMMKQKARNTGPYESLSFQSPRQMQKGVEHLAAELGQRQFGGDQGWGGVATTRTTIILSRSIIPTIPTVPYIIYRYKRVK